MTAPKLIAFALGAALAAVAAGACGGGSTDQGDDSLDAAGTGMVDLGPGQTGPADGGILVAGTEAGTAIDVCGLLTLGEASEFAGEALSEPTVDSYASGHSICTYGATTTGSHTFVQVSLFVETPELTSSGYDAARIFEAQRQSNLPVDEVGGIGDAAYGHANSLEVLVGDVIFGVRITRSDASGTVDVPLGELEAMARVVLTRIGEPRG